ncbi:MAG TPA: hypothetical protein PLL53_03760 [Saprospiraceae bacterium]|nr:hypothetical protein [Saprospiraceae bacterium]
MKKLMTFLGFFLTIVSVYSQTTRIYDDDSGDHSWNNPVNWDGNATIPSAGDLIIFSAANLTLSGVVANFPSNITIDKDNITFSGLTVTIDATATTNHGLDINNGRNLTISNSSSITIATANDREAIRFKGTTTAASVTVDASSSIQINACDDGILLMSSFNSFTNNGTITISSADSDGIDNLGTFTNNAGATLTIESNVTKTTGILNKSGSNSGTINMPTAGNTQRGIDNDNATATNNSGGTITITGVSIDALRTLTGGSFTNNGTLNLTIEDASASTNDNTLEIGASTSFINNSTGVVNADGGTLGASSRTISVAGTLDNAGAINVLDGNELQQFRIETGGTATNNQCATIILLNGRLFNNASTFTNNGYFESGYTSSSVTGTNPYANINNGFYNLQTGLSWFTGDNGSNNGVDVSGGTLDYDLNGSCVIDFNTARPDAMAAYTWSYNGVPIGTNGANGQLTFDDLFPDQAGPHVLATQCMNYASEFSITTSDVCLAALPITLASFRATPLAASVLLEWRTASEQNNDYMAVERSTDGIKFEEIGRLPGIGSTSEPQYYRLEDRRPAQGINYYRLRQADYDGTLSFSDVLSVRFRGEGKKEALLLYPTLLSPGEMVQIDLRELPADELQIDIVRTDGSLVASHRFSGGGVVALPTGGLSQGVYLARLNGAHSTAPARFVMKSR